ncbi:MAG: hypothetical protein CVV53_01365 [Spirochaetae bacterium HGW-Spirochaetae-9]|nr:MAG: hypothetical protein CVV53_01365 [Spirochaetae bacterium HGW-Spirochaetae-9]
MKTIRNRAFLLALLVVMLFGSCELFESFKRDLPPVIQLYNSALQRTNKLLPNDTLYVKVSGLAANTMYEVECLDTNGDPISSILAESDATGVIQPTALWYDIGFKWDATLNSGAGGIKLASDAELGLSAFEVHVKTLDGTATDFSLDFFIVYNTEIERPQPIVMAGELVGGVFNLENALDAGDTLYVKVANLEKGLPTGQTYATVNVVPFTGTNYEDGDPIDNVYISMTMTLDELKNGTAIPWKGGSVITSNTPDDRGKAFSVIVDFDNNGYFNVLKEGTANYYLDSIDGNGVAGFIIRQPPIVTAQTVSLNLVSGGIFTYSWQNYQYDYDYRDTFRKDGSDTKVAYYYGVGPGVKVIWNPYTYYNSWSNDPTGTGLYYGRYIDLYIIKSGGSSAGWTLGADLLDTTILVRKLRLPVQYGCANGLNQQTIWPAPMIPGDYALVLDMDNSKTITNGDIIDDWDRAGVLRIVDTKRSGFSINP